MGRFSNPLTNTIEALKQMKANGDDLTPEGETILRKAPPNFKEEFEKEAMLLSNEDLRLVQEKIDELIEERDKIFMAQKLTKEQLLYLYNRRGYYPKMGDKFWKITALKQGRGMYGWEVGKYEHSCSIDTTDMLVLLVVEPGAEGQTYVVDVCDLWLDGPIVV